jgi:hypothetical protein
MITITENDTNLPLIMKEGKLSNLVTKQKYHVFGLRQENNAPISIEYESGFLNESFKKRIKSLVEFFKLNEIDVECISNSSNRRIDIGLRIDVRQLLNPQGKPVFASSVLSTIIYCLEDRVNIEQMKQYKLPSMPKLPPKIG